MAVEVLYLVRVQADVVVPDMDGLHLVALSLTNDVADAVSDIHMIKEVKVSCLSRRVV